MPSSISAATASIFSIGAEDNASSLVLLIATSPDSIFLFASGDASPIEFIDLATLESLNIVSRETRYCCARRFAVDPE
jgi:hypothetical protein